MATYNLGDLVRCTGTLEDTAGTLVDPSVARGWYRNPAGTVTTVSAPTLVHNSLGTYYFDVDASAAGEWYYGFYSTGTGQAASTDMRFVVESSLRT